MSKSSKDNEFVVKKPWSGKVILVSIGLALSLIIMSWYYYEYHYFATKEIPLLVGESSPTKMRPEKSDGALVPHTDKMVYDSLKPNSESSSTRLMSMMPEPEQPIEVAQSGSGDTVEDVIARVLSENYIELPNKPEAEVIEEKAAEEPAKTLKIIPVESMAIENQQNKINNNKIKSFYKVQLVSVRTQNIAEKECARLKKIHNKYLGSLPFSVQKINVENHGVFYRLLVGKFSSAGEAKALCRKLIAGQQNCIVVKD